MVVVMNVGSPKPRGDNGEHKKKALLVAQEISFAKVLAGNDKKLRDRGVKRLRKWLNARSRADCGLKQEDFMRLWKGLFYCMWMADKPLFQEELAETISLLIHCFHNHEPAIKFIEGFFKTMATEWRGIDQFRLDKFLMFVRRFLRQSLELVARKDWNIQVAEEVSSVFQRTLLPDHLNLSKVQPPLGLVMHFCEIYLEEIAKVSRGDLDESVLLCLLRPFAHHLAAVRDSRIRCHIRQHIFIRLLEQSPVGLEFQDKFNAWRSLGFPGGNIDVMERDEDGEAEDINADGSDDEILENAVDGEIALDPRAGKVDVELPLIKFNARNVAKVLEEYQRKKFTNSKTRKILSDLISKFEKLSEGDFPLGLKEVPEVPDEDIEELTEEAAEDLFQFKSKLLHDEDSNDDGDDVEEGNAEDIKGNRDKLSKKTKRKNSLSEKKTGKRARVDVEVQKVDESRPLISSKDQKKKKLISKSSKSRSQLPKIDAFNVSVKAEAEVDAEVGKIAEIKIASPRNIGVEKSSNAAVDASDDASMQSQSGTKALLQHLAPHVVGSKKLKRRASCDAKLQTSIGEKEMNDPADLSPTSSNSDHGKKLKKRKSLGWDEPLQDGEYEIFIPKEKIVARKKRLSAANESLPTPSKVQNPFASPAPGLKLQTPGSSSKKVNFVLQRNTAQATSDYFRTLRENPAIPYDANKEPPRGVLKPSPYSSPVNPFYKRKLRI